MTFVADAGDVFTVRTKRKIQLKIRRCNGSGADTIMLLSEPEEVYRVSFTSAECYTTTTLCPSGI